MMARLWGRDFRKYKLHAHQPKHIVTMTAMVSTISRANRMAFQRRCTSQTNGNSMAGCGFMAISPTNRPLLIGLVRLPNKATTLAAPTSAPYCPLESERMSAGLSSPTRITNQDRRARRIKMTAKANEPIFQSTKAGKSGITETSAPIKRAKGG